MTEDPGDWTLSDRDRFGQVYDELKTVARARLARQVGAESLDATALVHEVWLKLSNESRPRFRDDAHFYATAAQAMRWILVDRARRRLALRRRHGRETLHDDARADEQDPIQTLAIDEALDRLRLDSPRRAQVVELRYFAGLPLEEVARVLDVSLATVKREWALARALLLRDVAARTQDLIAAPRPDPENPEPPGAGPARAPT